MGSGLDFGSAIRVKGWRGNEKREKDGSAGRLTTSVWSSYRYRSHKKKKVWGMRSWVKCAKWVGLGNCGILSYEWWVTKIEWGVMSDDQKKKNQTAPKNPLSSGI